VFDGMHFQRPRGFWGRSGWSQVIRMVLFSIWGSLVTRPHHRGVCPERGASPRIPITSPIWRVVMLMAGMPSLSGVDRESLRLLSVP
jgi:hypothetical protein